MRLNQTPRLSLIVAVAAFGVGCGGYGDYCAEQRDCQALNEADEEACSALIDASAEVASIYNCSGQSDALIDCVIAESSCEGTGDNKVYTTIDFSDGDNDDRCGNERSNLNDCIDGASDYDNNDGNN